MRELVGDSAKLRVKLRKLLAPKKLRPQTEEVLSQALELLLECSEEGKEESQAVTRESFLAKLP